MNRQNTPISSQQILDVSVQGQINQDKHRLNLTKRGWGKQNPAYTEQVISHINLTATLQTQPMGRRTN